MTLSFALAVTVRRLGRRIVALTIELEQNRDSLAVEQGATESGLPEKSEEHRRKRTLSILRRALAPAQTLAVLRAVRDIIVWLFLLLWCAGGAWAAFLFPQTTPLGHTFARNAFIIASIFIVTGILDRALTIVIGRLPAVWEHRDLGNAEQRERQALRMPTIVRAMNRLQNVHPLFLCGALRAHSGRYPGRLRRYDRRGCRDRGVASRAEFDSAMS